MGLKRILQAWLVEVTSSWGLEIAEIPLRNYGQSYGQDFRLGHQSSINTFQINTVQTEETGQKSLENCVSYQCALALQLAPRWGISAGEIAEKLVAKLNNSLLSNQQDKQNINLPFLSVQPQVIDRGIIDLRVSDRTLAQWLEQLRLQSSADQKNNSQIDPEIINHLPIQSAHARCCSLLRLAAREKLIQLGEQSPEQLQHQLQNQSQKQLLDPWQIYLPSAIPWLDEQGKLRLTIPQERYLVNLLVNLVDEFDAYQDSTKNRKSIQKWLRLATEISRGFANFDRYSQIFGETRLKDLPTAQARLGLIVITRWGLQELLVTYLGAIAPSEL